MDAPSTSKPPGMSSSPRASQQFADTTSDTTTDCWVIPTRAFVGPTLTVNFAVPSERVVTVSLDDVPPATSISNDHPGPARTAGASGSRDPWIHACTSISAGAASVGRLVNRQV